MVIKVDYDELKNVNEKAIKNCSLLDHEIDRLLKTLEELKNCWKGIDSDTFYNKAYDYFKRMKVLPAFQSSMTNFIKESSNQYKQNDKELSDKLKKEKDELERRNSIQYGEIQSNN